jgi:hypothetical protein
LSSKWKKVYSKINLALLISIHILGTQRDGNKYQKKVLLCTKNMKDKAS